MIYIDEELIRLNTQMRDMRELSKERAPFVEHLVSMIEAIPESCLEKEKTGIERILFEFRQAVRIWTSGDSNHARIHKVGQGKGEPQLSRLRSLLQSCPDQISTEQTPTLEFVKDDAFRQILRRDIASVEHSLSAFEWKAATVLGGSALEALLLDSIPEDRRNPTAKLKDLIRSAKDEGIIDERLADLCRKLTDFRDLIHPAREKRMSSPCTRGVALSAAGALHQVIEHLESAYSKSQLGQA